MMDFFQQIGTIWEVKSNWKGKILETLKQYSSTPILATSARKAFHFKASNRANIIPNREKVPIWESELFCVTLMWLKNQRLLELDERFEILTYFLGFLQVIILSKIILYKPVHYGEYTYPLWASVVLGWLINIFILIWIPLGMVHTLTRTTGTFWQVIHSKMNETRKKQIYMCVKSI